MGLALLYDVVSYQHLTRRPPFFIYPIFPSKIRASRLFFCAPFVLVTFAEDRTVVSFR